MSRTTTIAMRYSALAIGLGLSGLYCQMVLPVDRNIISLKATIVAFLATYLLMTTSLLIFNRLRKFDIALLCGAALAVAMVSQLFAYKMGQAPFPHLSEMISGVMGILAALLPVCVAKIRTDARHDRESLKHFNARRMVAGASPSYRQLT